MSEHRDYRWSEIEQLQQARPMVKGRTQGETTVTLTYHELFHQHDQQLRHSFVLKLVGLNKFPA